jgi:hypothetical protein
LWLNQQQQWNNHKSNKETTTTIIGMVANQANQDTSLEIIIGR